MEKDHSSVAELPAALPAERRVSARQGWAGENRGLFEHLREYILVVLYVLTIEVFVSRNSVSAAC